MGTIVVSIILIAVVACSVASIVKAKKAGKHPGCSCGCDNCNGCSH